MAKYEQLKCFMFTRGIATLCKLDLVHQQQWTWQQQQSSSQDHQRRCTFLARDYPVCFLRRLGYYYFYLQSVRCRRRFLNSLRFGRDIEPWDLTVPFDVVAVCCSWYLVSVFSFTG